MPVLNTIFTIQSKPVNWVYQRMSCHTPSSRYDMPVVVRMAYIVSMSYRVGDAERFLHVIACTLLQNLQRQRWIFGRPAAEFNEENLVQV